MLFQYYGGAFSETFYYLQQWGILDVLLPFILIFTVIYAVMKKVNMFEQRFNAVISLAIALTAIIPHILGYYPPGMDIIVIINTALPEFVLLIVAVVLLLIMLGLIWGKGPAGTATAVLISFVAAAILILIFLSEVFPMPILSYLSPEVKTVLIVLLVFGVVFWYVTREEGAGKKTVGEHLKSLIEDWIK